MSWVGDVIKELKAAWAWWQERRDPARAQAQRLIAAFEAHGVARQQMARLLPASLAAIPTTAFSSPDKLKAHLSPALLDWAAELLALRRGWLDGMNVQPHAVVWGYKHMAVYREWLEARVQSGSADRILYIWKTEPGELGPDSAGLLCAVCEEMFDRLDDEEVSRYWRLSDGWWLGHPPCIENMVALVALAQSLGIVVLGRVVPEKLLKQMECGELLIAQAAKHAKPGWHPDDLVTPLPGKDTPWRQAVWVGAQRYLR